MLRNRKKEDYVFILITIFCLYLFAIFTLYVGLIFFKKHQNSEFVLLSFQVSLGFIFFTGIISFFYNKLISLLMIFIVFSFVVTILVGNLIMSQVLKISFSDMGFFEFFDIYRNYYMDSLTKFIFYGSYTCFLFVGFGFSVQILKHFRKRKLKR